MKTVVIFTNLVLGIEPCMIFESTYHAKTYLLQSPAIKSIEFLDNNVFEFETGSRAGKGQYFEAIEPPVLSNDLSKYAMSDYITLPPQFNTIMGKLFETKNSPPKITQDDLFDKDKKFE